MLRNEKKTSGIVTLVLLVSYLLYVDGPADNGIDAITAIYN
jgi:hypothetical protein